ncbi:MurR/RpiR family transcriptional regulator [Brachybacterium sp. FME24]|uniref:MurR/RpiR family transcriptional regulator n=1 Tax=Brachybacterium sp. FME24 TaxID=2742605 RepID=UPI001867E088|nr:MurR/RpiR family transcriptional regulator [Brachybacterium sp. FME24]
MTFTDRVQEQRSRLTQGDRTLLDEILAHPSEAPLWRGEDLARRAGVHPAAATRLAQRLGYGGYLQLREDLRADHNRRLLGSGDRFRTERRDRGEQGTLDALVDSELHSLAAIARHVEQRQIDDAADRIVAARRVFVFGRGNATILAELLDRRLRRFGIPTVNLTGSGRDVAERIVPMQEDDLLLAVAFRRAPRDLGPLLGHTRAVGATSLLVTDTLHLLEPAPSVVLSAPRGDQQGFASLAVPMTIVNAIVLASAQRHPDVTLPALDRLDDLLTTFD